MERLADIFYRVPEKDRQAVLCDCFVFPRVEEPKGKPCMIYAANALDIDLIKKFTVMYPDVITFNMRKDLLAILDAISEVKDVLWLDAYDYIQLTRGGIELLRISLTHAESRGRAALLDMNEYRLRLQQVDANPMRTRLATVGMSVAATFATAFILRVLVRSLCD